MTMADIYPQLRALQDRADALALGTQDLANQMMQFAPGTPMRNEVAQKTAESAAELARVQNELMAALLVAQRGGAA